MGGALLRESRVEASKMSVTVAVTQIQRFHGMSEIAGRQAGLMLSRCRRQKASGCSITLRACASSCARRRREGAHFLAAGGALRQMLRCRFVVLVENGRRPLFIVQMPVHFSLLARFSC